VEPTPGKFKQRQPNEARPRFARPGQEGSHARRHVPQVDGIKGESTHSDHKDEIDVLSWRWGMTSSAHVAAGGGVGAATVSFRDLSIGKRIDAATAKLMLSCASGQHISPDIHPPARYLGSGAGADRSLPDNPELASGFVRVCAWNLHHLNLEEQARQFLPGQNDTEDFAILIATFAKGLRDLGLRLGSDRRGSRGPASPIAFSSSATVSTAQAVACASPEPRPVCNLLIFRPRSSHYLNSMIRIVLGLLRLFPFLVGSHRHLALENLALRERHLAERFIAETCAPPRHRS
jgi:Type VI secretion system effector, Hcp